MERVIKIVSVVFIAAILVAIGIISMLPKDRLTFEEEMKVRESIQALNDDLPRRVGSIGTLDSIKFERRTICYNMTVFGESEIIDFYRSHYEDFHIVALYSYATLNGQNGNASTLAEYCKAKKIGTRTTVFFKDNESISWDFSPDELYDFLLSFEGTPTDAMTTVLDFDIALANYNLSNVATNSIDALSDEGIALISLEHQDNNIVWTWGVDEKRNNINDLSASFHMPNAAEVFISEMVQDPDFQELVNMISISHSNIVLRYKGVASGHITDLLIPYDILKQYSQVPFLH